MRKCDGGPAWRLGRERGRGRGQLFSVENHGDLGFDGEFIGDLMAVSDVSG
jgi:hypothetical protein